MANVTQGDPGATAPNSTHTKWLDSNVSIGFLVQTDGALLFKFQQSPLDVKVPLEGSILLLDQPPQSVDLGVGRLVCLLRSHQRATQSRNTMTTSQRDILFPADLICYHSNLATSI